MTVKTRGRAPSIYSLSPNQLEVETTRNERKQKEAGNPEGVNCGRESPSGFSRTSFCGEGRYKLTALAGAMPLSPGLLGGRRGLQTRMTDTHAAEQRHNGGDAQ